MVCVPLVVLALAAAQGAPTQPDIVLLFSDDAGYGDFGFTGSLQIKTPAIDSIAREGVVFNQGYVAGSVCSPSRAGMLTGRYQNRFGHEDNLAIGELQPGDVRADIGLPLEEKTMADLLKKAGYRTGLVGKWHLGEEEKFHPKNRGFDEWYFFRGGSRPYVEGQVPKAQRLECSYKAPGPVTYLTDDLGREAAAFIARRDKRPYFLYASFNAPHTPLQSKPEDLVGLEYIEDRRRRNYVGMMAALDRAVGSILKAVRESGRERETIVVFLNDNGGQIDAGAVNVPLRGMKGTFLEGGVRVPFAIRWPARVAAGSTFAPPVTSLDLLPTFLAAAGGGVEPPKPLDGVDLLPYVRGEQEGRPHEKMFWRMGFTGAVRDGDWKLIRMPDRPPYLFDLATDPSESNNLFFQEPERARTMFQTLFEWEQQMIYPRWNTAPVWYKDNADRYNRPYRTEQPKGKTGQSRGRGETSSPVSTLTARSTS